MQTINIQEVAEELADMINDGEFILQSFEENQVFEVRNLFIDINLSNEQAEQVLEIVHGAVASI